MNKKLLGIILIGISLLIGLALIYFIFFYHPTDKEPVENTSPISTSTPATGTIPTQPVIPLPKPKDTTPVTSSELSEESARQLASSFAELYGSYSNQATGDRLKDLEFYVTRDYLSRITKASRNLNDNYTVYSGHKTRAIATQILIMEDSRAVLMITTLRTETSADGTEKSVSQDIKVELVKQASVWRVGNAVWQ